VGFFLPRKRESRYEDERYPIDQQRAVRSSAGSPTEQNPTSRMIRRWPDIVGLLQEGGATCCGTRNGTEHLVMDEK